jgi:hypothetical protein
VKNRPLHLRRIAPLCQQYASSCFFIGCRAFTRDLAMFNLAIDSKLRGCDVVTLKVEDIEPSGYAVDRAI